MVGRAVLEAHTRWASYEAAERGCEKLQRLSDTVRAVSFYYYAFYLLTPLVPPRRRWLSWSAGRS